MNRISLGTLAAVATLAIAAACTEQPEPLPTQPPPPSFAVVPACDAALAKQIASEQNELFKSPQIQEARQRFNVIQTGCPNTKQEMLDYVRFTIANLAAALDPNRSSPPTRDEAMVAHWNSMFTFVGLPAPGLPPAVLGAGAAKVCDANVDCDVPTGDLKAELFVPVQSAANFGRHLYSLYPRTNGCFASNLDQTGPCYQVDANPTVASFAPFVKVGICQPVSASEQIPGLGPALAHEVKEGAVARTRVTNRLAAPFPTFCEDLAMDGLRESLSRYGSLGRLASAAIDLVTPTPLYAVHGGLGGSGGKLSPFGGVDSWIFKGTFSTPPNTVGSPPSLTSDKGTFDPIQLVQPGSAIVQSSIGDPTSGLRNQPVVLNQGGGNCSACGSLILRGVVTTADAGQSASYGKYLVSWESLQNKPTLKMAPFVLRGSGLQEIARVAYETRNSQNKLTYNGVVLTSVTWAQGVAQRFEVLVNLDAKTTSLRIAPRDGPATPVPEAQNVPFVAGATNLKYLAAEFTGIDAGIIGWDNLAVVRQSDETP